jgi:hypothetical protein
MTKTKKNAFVVWMALVIALVLSSSSSRRNIFDTKANLSSLSFAPQELDATEDMEVNIEAELIHSISSLSFAPQEFDVTEDTGEDIETELIHSISTRRPQRVFELPYEEQKGSWIGNHWVPPNGWRYFSTEELRTVYKDKSVMWIGDSLARRASATMYGILNEANDVNVPVAAIDAKAVIQVNKVSITQPCRKWPGSCERGKRHDCTHQPRWCPPKPGGVGDYVYVKKEKFSDIIAFLSDELSGKYNITGTFDTVIIALGNHDTRGPLPETLSLVTTVIDMLGKLQSSGKTIIWRTYPGSSSPSEKFFKEVNKKAVDRITSIQTRLQQENNTVSNLTCINWSGALYPRSFGSDRIAGDSKVHYGLEARIVFIQMITNHLASRQGLYF